MMKLPTAETIATLATREIDELMQELEKQDLQKHLDVHTQRLLREVMILAWQRGASYMAVSLGYPAAEFVKALNDEN